MTAASSSVAARRGVPRCMPELSPVQERVLAFLCRYADEQGFPPSLREIMAGAGLSSLSVAGYALAGLERRGCIRRVAGQSRAIDLRPAAAWWAENGGRREST